MASSSLTLQTTRSTWTVSTSYVGSVYIIGNSKDLGNWCIENALPMKHVLNSRSPFKWSINLTLADSSPVEFKFLVITPEGELLWEDDENRQFIPGAGDSAVDWGCFRCP